MVSFVLVSAIAAIGQTSPDYRKESSTAVRALNTAIVQQKVVREQPPVHGADLSSLTPLQIKCMDLQQNQAERCMLSLDIPKKTWKMEIDDVRNVRAILQANSLSDDQLMNVSRSSSLLVWETGTARWTPAAMNLLIRERSVRTEFANQPIFEIPVETGCIPDAIFQYPIIQISKGRVDGREVDVLTFSGSGQTLAVHLDPTIGYRYRRWERRSGDRIVEERIAKDYKAIGNIPFPFFHEKNTWTASGEKLLHEIIMVEAARLNVPLQEGDLAISVESGTVTDVAKQITVPIHSGRTINTGNVLSLGEELNAENAAWNAQRMQQWRAEHPHAKPKGPENGRGFNSSQR